ncbi:MAG TPA: hypothetical protein VFL13_10090, partial [Candidatus Baltobacteraceae bacterium]|nr:hypothetical protein [Candidatus Baltobacteraceae bacterium]
RITEAKAFALLPQAQAFTAAAQALDADADAAVQSGDTARASADQAKLRAAEAAFFNINAATWNRSILYATSGKFDILPDLEKSSGTIATALQAATAAAKG